MNEKARGLAEEIRKKPYDADLRIAMAAEFDIEGFPELAMRQYKIAIDIAPNCADAYDSFYDLLVSMKSKKLGPVSMGEVDLELATIVSSAEMLGIYAEGAKRLGLSR